MAHSSEVVANVTAANASQYNNLRKDTFQYLTDSGSGIASGKFVYFDGDDTIGVASSSAIGTVFTVGCSVEGAIAGAASGYIQDRGHATNANWSFQAGDIGKLAYLGTDGYPTINPPVDSGTVVRIIGIIAGTDSMFIITDSNYEEN